MKISQPISLVTVAILSALPMLQTFLVAQEATIPAPKSQEVVRANSDDAATAIDWRVLAPENGKPFNDPFARLTGDQLAALSYVARIRRLVAENKIDQDGIDAKAAAKLSRKLAKEGVDIGYLLVQRQHVQRTRVLQVKDRSKLIADSLDDKQVTLTGFVVPITFRQRKMTEFFIVPTVSTCSNEAAPSPLQVVFVSTDKGIVHPDKKLAVRVTGAVQAETTKRTIRNGVRATTVQSAYAMPSPKIEFYAQTE